MEQLKLDLSSDESRVFFTAFCFYKMHLETELIVSNHSLDLIHKLIEVTALYEKFVNLVFPDGDPFSYNYVNHESN